MGEKAGEMTEPVRNDEHHVIRDGERRTFGAQQSGVAPQARVVQARAVSSDDPAVIRREMGQTRAEMSQTIDAIQDRLEPEVLKEHALDVLREAGEQAKGIIQEARHQAEEVVHDATTQTKQAVHDATVGKAEKLINNASESARETGSNIWDTIRNNPIPAGLIGIGLGWLMMNGQSSGPRRSYTRTQYYPGSAPRYREYGYATGQEYGYGSEYAGTSEGRFSGTAYQTRESVGGVAHDAQSAVSSGVHQASETVGDVANQAGQVVSGVAQQVSDTAGDVVHQAGQAVSGVASQTHETFSDVAEQARYQTWQARSSLEDALETNPLAVGAAAFGIGAAIALLVPTTRPEQEWMGETRDHLMHQAQETLRETQEKVQHVVSEAGSAAKETAEQEAKKQGLASSN